MLKIKYIFQCIVLSNQDIIFEKYNKLIKEINKGSKKYNKDEMKDFFIFTPIDFINNIIECKIFFFQDYYEANLTYKINEEIKGKHFSITKYEFNFESKDYICYEKRFMRKHLDDNYKKKNFL